MSFYIKNTEDITRELTNKLWTQQEEYIKEALTELISRGLIVVEKTQPTITQKVTPDGRAELNVSQAIRLVPKEFDYIKKLEKENKELKEKLDKIKQLF